MTGHNLILQATGISFEVHGGGLRFKPKPSAELLEPIRAHKPSLMALFIASMTAELPNDPALHAEVHRLLDQADVLDLAGDVQGMQRILADIKEMIVRR